MPRPKKEQPNHAGGLYEVKITVGKTIDGKLIRKSFYSSTSKADARAQAEQYKIDREVASQTGAGFISKDITFADWARKWLKIYKQPSVKASTYTETYLRPVESYLIPILGRANLQDIRPADIKALYTKIGAKYSQSTIEKVKICLNGIFESAIDNDLCYKNPAKNISVASCKPSTGKRIYTKAQRDTVVAFAQEHKNGIPVLLLLVMGLRRSEMMALCWEDIDLERRIIHIRKAVTMVNNHPVEDVPKSQSSIRDLPIPFDLYICLTVRQSTGKIVDIQSPTAWQHVRYKKFMDDLTAVHPDVPRLTPHELRHTCGTLLYQDTRDIYAVSKFLGHSDIGITTKIYVHNDPESLRKNLNMGYSGALD